MLNRMSALGASAHPSWTLTLAVVFLMLLVLSGTARAAAITVTNTSDSGLGSLRQAILDANAAPSLDTISFNIPGCGPGTGTGPVCTIKPLTILPPITAPVTVDGALSDPLSFAVGHPFYPSLRKPGIELDGSLAGAGIVEGGLLLRDHSGSTIRGMVVNRFGGRGIRIDGTGGSHTVAENYLGTDSTGSKSCLVAAVPSPDAGPFDSFGLCDAATDGTPYGNRLGIEVQYVLGVNVNPSIVIARNVASGNNQRGILVLGLEGGVAPEGAEISNNVVGTGINGASPRLRSGTSFLATFLLVNSSGLLVKGNLITDQARVTSRQVV